MCLSTTDPLRELHAGVAHLLKETQALQDWCTQPTLERYLRARNGDVAKATAMLKHTIQWRASYQPDKITWESVSDEASSGKQVITEFQDTDGSVLIAMRPRLENSRSDEGQLRFLVYTLEMGSRLADLKREGLMTWLIDFDGYTLKNAPSLKVASTTLHILQNHYPERLGRAICFHAPLLFSVTWRALQPFIDRHTARKIIFVTRADHNNDALLGYLAPDTLAACGVGVRDWKFDLGAYARMCQALEQRVEAAVAGPDNGNTKVPDL